MSDKPQIESMKEQVIEHINKNFPEEKKQDAIEQILSMNDEEFLELLKENNIIDNQENERGDKCIFCSIVFGEIPSVKISENEKAIALLEINPITEGHTLVVPKAHVSSKEKIDKKTEDLILLVKEKLENSLNPKEIKIFVSEVTGHQIINLVPIYSSETIDSKRTHATNEELLKVKNKIENSESNYNKNKINEVEKSEEKIEEPKKEIYSGRIPRRFP